LRAAAGLPNEWPSGIAFLAFYCEISEMMSADDANALRIPVREFLQGSSAFNFSPVNRKDPNGKRGCRLEVGAHCAADYEAFKSAVSVPHENEAQNCGPE
jgi:hypothetical protein